MNPRSGWRIAAAIWAAGLIIFVLMAFFASSHDTFPGDTWLTRRVQDFSWAPWVDAMDQTEDLAQGLHLAFIVPGATIIGLVLLPLLSAFLIPLTLFVRPLVPLLKEIVERPRPTPEEVNVAPGQPTDFSFPSGHAFSAMLVYSLLFYLASAHIRNAWVRVPVQAACAWVIVVTGIERIYSGSHWPSDVLGGYLLAALIVGVLAAIDRLVSKRRAR